MESMEPVRPEEIIGKKLYVKVEGKKVTYEVRTIDSGTEVLRDKLDRTAKAGEEEDKISILKYEKGYPYEVYVPEPNPVSYEVRSVEAIVKNAPLSERIFFKGKNMIELKVSNGRLYATRYVDNVLKNDDPRLQRPMEGISLGKVSPEQAFEDARARIYTKLARREIDTRINEATKGYEKFIAQQEDLRKKIQILKENSTNPGLTFHQQEKIRRHIERLEEVV